MKNIVFIIMLLNIQVFSQISDLNIKNTKNYNSFNFQTASINSININSELLSVKNKSSYVFKQQELQNNGINLNLIQNKKCPNGSMFFIFVPLISIYTGYLAYDEFQSGNKKQGYVFAGISTGLIVIPISIMWYCSKR